MRHGLMLWREDELSEADVLARQRGLQAAMTARGIDAVIVYTNHVRSAGVTYLTGFTPYWSDALLVVPRERRAIFATALSKRVGNWIKSNNPTVDLVHSPFPGKLAGERLAELGAARVGVVELERLPGGLAAEISSACEAELVEATDLFAEVRSHPDSVELALAIRADAIAVRAFATVPAEIRVIGDVTRNLERAVREAGAEECYVAAAPDLEADFRLQRAPGIVAVGNQFAVRLSVAYNGVWVRRTESFSRSRGNKLVKAASALADRVARGFDLSRPPEQVMSSVELPAGMTVEDYLIEGPGPTRPLQFAAGRGHAQFRSIPYGVVTLRIGTLVGPLVFSRPIGLDISAGQRTGAA